MEMTRSRVGMSAVPSRQEGKVNAVRVKLDVGAHRLDRLRRQPAAAPEHLENE